MEIILVGLYRGPDYVGTLICRQHSCDPTFKWNLRGFWSSATHGFSLDLVNVDIKPPNAAFIKSQIHMQGVVCNLVSSWSSWRGQYIDFVEDPTLFEPFRSNARWPIITNTRWLVLSGVHYVQPIHASISLKHQCHLIMANRNLNPSKP